MLIRQLPPESATATALRLENPTGAASAVEPDPESEQWSRVEHLLAAVKDELTALRFSFISVNSKHRPRWKPQPTPRPGVKPKRKRTRLSEDQTRTLAQYLQRVQGEPEPIPGPAPTTE